MVFFRMRTKLRLTFVFLLLKMITSGMTNLNDQRDNQNKTNDFLDEYSPVPNDSLGAGFSGLRDSESTNASDYETVVVRPASPIDKYFTPILIILGISGNMLALHVFFFSKLRHQSTSQYLSALAISDTVFLADLCPPWLSTMEINSIFHRNAYCKVFVYISYVTCCLSSWLVIAFTVERFIAIQYPLQRPSVCTVRRARYIIVALTVGAMLVNLPVIHFAGSENQMCHIDREKLEEAAKFNWVDTAFTFTIPLMLIIFFNTWIAALVYRLERDRIKLTQEELRAAATMGQRKSRDSDFIYLRSQRRITNMLLVVSTIFVIFNSPAYTLRVCGYAYDLDSSELDDHWLTAQNVATMMFNANFGINFYLYCFTGQNFRRALVQTVPWCGWIARKANAILNRSPVNQGRTCSVTTSAASTGTDATCMEMSFVNRNTRRRRRRTGNYIARWTFDNTRQRCDIAGSVAFDSINMAEIVPQPGSSRVVVDDLPPTGVSHGLSSVPTNAALESSRPVIESRRPGIQLRRPAIASRRSSTVDLKCSSIQLRRNPMEMRRRVLPRFTLFGIRKTSLSLTMFRRDSAKIRREQAHLYD